MIGIGLVPLMTSWVSKTMKSIGWKNLSTYTKTFSTIPLGIFMDLSTKRRVVVVGFNSLNPNCSYIEHGCKLTLAPKSSNALSILKFQITQEKIGQPRSLYLITL